MRNAAITALALALLATACGDKLDPDQPPTCDPALPVSYAQEVGPVLESYCTRCHSSSAANRRGAPEGVDFDTYAAAAAAAEMANQRVQAGTMPPSGASPRPDARARCLLQAWVDQGLPEN